MNKLDTNKSDPKKFNVEDIIFIKWIQLQQVNDKNPPSCINNAPCLNGEAKKIVHVL